MQLQILQPDLHNIIVFGLNGSIFRKQRHRPWSRCPLFEDFNGFAPGFTLRIVNLTKVKDLSLHDPPARHTPALNNIPVPVLLAVLLPFRAS